MKLADYIKGVVACLERHEPESAAALRRVLGERVQRIRVDEEIVDMRFVRDRLHVRRRKHIDGEGSTTRAAVCALIDGTLDFHDALACGELALRADLDNLTRMWAAIEIVLDASARVPGLREWSRVFRAEHGSFPAMPVQSETNTVETEIALLARLDLLSDVP